ncbi:MAG: hypothetical protein IPJ19_20580 [Planctomycetes bacterium]|nr:hypothetical protein [Planctomycetota bacterium]
MRIQNLIPTLFLATPLCAFQEAPLRSYEVSRAIDTGLVSNTTPARAVVASFSVEQPGAAWLRLSFDETLLAGDENQGTGSFVRITSMQDAATQTLHARHLREWRNTSAYFNGDALLVEIVAEPGTGPNRLHLAGVTVGTDGPQNLTQCGATDDRVLSSDPRQGRALPVGCTAWMINDCGHCFLTAGHCLGGTLSVVEFNVPLSTGSGTLLHPPPQDQYAADASSKQFTNGGVGNDWGYFGCFPNSTTGLLPFEVQHASYVLGAPPSSGSSAMLRVTGYGVDSTPPTSNQVQQTSTGPFWDLVGNRVEYQVDTEGGNSGSPVISTGPGVAIAIHTHGGCSTSASSYNSGTSILHPGLQAALANPHGVCNVGCSASTWGYCTAKLNSQGCLPVISATGTPSASGGAGSFTLHASNMINHKTGLLLYSIGSANTAFQGGTLCLANPLVRTSSQNSGGNPGADDCSGTYSYDMGARIASGLDANLQAGTTIYAQWYQHDPASPSAPVGLSAGLGFVIGL